MAADKLLKGNIHTSLDMHCGARKRWHMVLFDWRIPATHIGCEAQQCQAPLHAGHHQDHLHKQGIGAREAPKDAEEAVLELKRANDASPAVARGTLCT